MEAENVLCKRDDVENKINNKFCMQHYETIANPTTCLALLLPAAPPSSLLPLCLRVGGQTAIGIFIACSTRRMRNTGTRLPGRRTARSLVAFFLWPLLTYAP